MNDTYRPFETIRSALVAVRGQENNYSALHGDVAAQRLPLPLAIWHYCPRDVRNPQHITASSACSPMPRAARGFAGHKMASWLPTRSNARQARAAAGATFPHLYPLVASAPRVPAPRRGRHRLHRRVWWVGARFLSSSSARARPFAREFLHSVSKAGDVGTYGRDGVSNLLIVTRNELVHSFWFILLARHVSFMQH